MSPADVLEGAIATLRARGERVTTARRALLGVLAATEEHLSADDIVDRLPPAAAGVHRATVYRTLDALVRAGVVAHVHLPHDAATYHIVGPDDRAHLHLVCQGCDHIVDAPSDLLDAVAEQLDHRLDFRLAPEHVALTGWCRRCVPPG